MSYIKITNTTSSVPRLYLEILGVSTKRDSDITIGQFGSGTKFAPIYALREGLEWINTGFDSHGGYTMSYQVSDDNDEGLDLVEFVYEDMDGHITKKPSSYSLGAGELGWNHPFQIFREAFANALDAHYEFDEGYSIDRVDEIEPPVEGEFSVYLTASDGLIEVVDNFDKYFSLERTPLFEDSRGNKVYEKLMSVPYDGVRIYHKGVLVYGGELEHDDTPSLFDYDLKEVSLNEERRLSDVSANEIYTIAKIIGENEHYTNSTGIRPVVDSIIDNCNESESGKPDGVWEYNFSYAFRMQHWYDVQPQDSDSFGNQFVAAMTAKYCDETYSDIAFVSDRAAAFYEIEINLNERGRKAIPVSDSMYELLNTTGAKEWMDKNILGEEYDTPFVELDGIDLEVFNFAYESVAEYDTDILNIPVKIMQSTAYNTGIQGKAMNVHDDSKRTVIALSQALIEGRNMQQIIATMLHELDHAVTGAADNTRAFRDAADNRLGDLIIRHYCSKVDLAKLVNKTEV